MDEVDGVEIGWALGMMVDESNKLATLSEEGKNVATLSTAGFVVMVLFGMALTVASSVALLWFHLRHNKRVLRRG